MNKNTDDGMIVNGAQRLLAGVHSIDRQQHSEGISGVRGGVLVPSGAQLGVSEFGDATQDPLVRLNDLSQSIRLLCEQFPAVVMTGAGKLILEAIHQLALEYDAIAESAGLSVLKIDHERFDAAAWMERERIVLPSRGAAFPVTLDLSDAALEKSILEKILEFFGIDKDLKDEFLKILEEEAGDEGKELVKAIRKGDFAEVKKRVEKVWNILRPKTDKILRKYGKVAGGRLAKQLGKKLLGPVGVLIAAAEIVALIWENVKPKWWWS